MMTTLDIQPVHVCKRTGGHQLTGKPNCTVEIKENPRLKREVEISAPARQVEAADKEGLPGQSRGR